MVTEQSWLGWISYGQNILWAFRSILSRGSCMVRLDATKNYAGLRSLGFSIQSPLSQGQNIV